MDLLAMSNYIICKPYSFPKEQSGLILDNNTDCFAEVIKSDAISSELKEGDIVWYDRAGAITCSISGNKYIAFKERNIISKIIGV